MTEELNALSKEDQLVAALSHAAVLIPTFGVIIPAIVFFTQKDRSAYLKKQSLQATTWQLLALLGYFLMGGCYFVGFIFIFPLSFLAESGSASENPAIGGAVFGAVLFIVMILLMFIYMIGGLVYLGIGLAGSVQVLRSKDFQYPFIGKWIDSRLENNEGSKTPDSPVEEASEKDPSKGDENDN